MTLPTDPIHPTDPHPAEHGSLATLARRGHERGAAGSSTAPAPTSAATSATGRRPPAR